MFGRFVPGPPKLLGGPCVGTLGTRLSESGTQGSVGGSIGNRALLNESQK